MAAEAIKRVTFKILSDVDPNIAAPRLGRLVVRGRKDVETPNFFAITSRGVLPHMTPDVIRASSQVGGVHMALEDFTEQAGNATPPLLKCPATPLHSFTALPHEIITLLAPRRTPAVLAPTGNTNTSISLFTSTGFQTLSNKRYITTIQKLRPDITIGLADVSHGARPGAKRIIKMGDRTESWMTELLNEIEEGDAVFAPVLPIDLQNQWEYLNYLADEKFDEIAGLALYDSNILPDLPATTSFAGLPRLSLDEPASPHHILRQVSLGMDIFTVPFTSFATDAGIALTFRFPQPTETTNSTPASLGVDMWDPIHAASLLPLSPSCSCYSCTSHHRAFVQHLLSAKEMLGWTLLQIHNHHIMDEFFKAIRISIKTATFEADCETFSKEYEIELPKKSGEGPRVRGYNSKSKGGGEGKKNKPAWGNLGGFEPEETAPVPEATATELVEKNFAEVTSAPPT